MHQAPVFEMVANKIVSDIDMFDTYWLETLGCPKNQVDSDKLEGKLATDGLTEAESPEEADLILVNTCTFIKESRKESLETIQALGEIKKSSAKLVATGCMAEKYGAELSQFGAQVDAVDAVVGFGVPVSITKGPVMGSSSTGSSSTGFMESSSTGSISLSSKLQSLPSFDLLNLPRPANKNVWAYLKIAEGCDRKCGYCAIPSFRGPQRSRSQDAILEELDNLEVKEIVLVAQDLAAYMKDKNSDTRHPEKQPIVSLVKEVTKRVEWVRLLYLYPSDLTPELIDAILATGVPYFDLSLQHVSKPLLRKMRRFGSADIFMKQISGIRRQAPNATFRSNFIVGYPGETEADHEELVDFIAEVQLDWAAFFLYSEETGTYSESLGEKVPTELARQRLTELQSLQLDTTENLRDKLIGEKTRVLVDAVGEARSFREAPEIDGVIHVPEHCLVGEFQEVKITGVSGCDLHAELI